MIYQHTFNEKISKTKHKIAPLTEGYETLTDTKSLQTGGTKQGYELTMINK